MKAPISRGAHNKRSQIHIQVTDFCLHMRLNEDLYAKTAHVITEVLISIVLSTMHVTRSAN